MNGGYFPELKRPATTGDGVRLGDCAVTSRRNLFLAVSAVGLLAGCGSVSDMIGKVPVQVTLPPEIATAVSDVTDIVKKVEPLIGTVGQVAEIVNKVKPLIDQVKNGAADAAGVLATVETWMKPLVDVVKPYLGGSVSTAIATLLPLIGGRRVMARTGMSPVQARAVLRS